MEKQESKVLKKGKLFRTAKTALASSAKSLKRSLLGKRMDRALIKAAINADERKVRRLLKAGADINARNEDGMTPLICAAAATIQMDKCKALDDFTEIMHEGHAEGVTKFLVEHGADVNARDKFGRTALMYALYNSYPDVAKILVESRADVTARGHDGRTTIMLAKKARSDVVESILWAPAGILFGKGVNEFKAAFEMCI